MFSAIELLFVAAAIAVLPCFASCLLAALLGEIQG